MVFLKRFQTKTTTTTTKSKRQGSSSAPSTRNNTTITAATGGGGGGGAKRKDVTNKNKNRHKGKEQKQQQQEERKNNHIVTTNDNNVNRNGATIQQKKKERQRSIKMKQFHRRMRKTHMQQQRQQQHRSTCTTKQQQQQQQQHQEKLFRNSSSNDTNKIDNDNDDAIVVNNNNNNTFDSSTATTTSNDTTTSSKSSGSSNSNHRTKKTSTNNSNKSNNGGRRTNAKHIVSPTTTTTTTNATNDKSHKDSNDKNKKTIATTNTSTATTTTPTVDVVERIEIAASRVRGAKIVQYVTAELEHALSKSNYLQAKTKERFEQMQQEQNRVSSSSSSSCGRTDQQHDIAHFHRSEIIVDTKNSEPLGRGGTGIVYEVQGFQLQDKISNKLSTTQRLLRDRVVQDAFIPDPKSGQRRRGRYAMKFIQPNLMNDQIPIASNLFYRAAADLVIEAAYLSGFDHPNIVKVHALPVEGVDSYRSGTHDGFFILTERVDETLEDRIIRRTNNSSVFGDSATGMDDDDDSSDTDDDDDVDSSRSADDGNNAAIKYIQDTISDAKQLSHAIQYLHDRRIVYRDLKPSNIGFVRSSGSSSDDNSDEKYDTLKLFDFGLCRELPPPMVRVECLVEVPDDDDDDETKDSGDDDDDDKGSVVDNDKNNKKRSEEDVDVAPSNPVRKAIANLTTSLNDNSHNSDNKQDNKRDDEQVASSLSSKYQVIDEVYNMSGVGTRRYMAPEVIVDGGWYNCKVDVYSFGIILWQMLSGGCKPFKHYTVQDHIFYVCQYNERPSFDAVLEHQQDILMTTTKNSSDHSDHDDRNEDRALRSPNENRPTSDDIRNSTSAVAREQNRMNSTTTTTTTPTTTTATIDIVRLYKMLQLLLEKCWSKHVYHRYDMNDVVTSLQHIQQQVISI